MKVAAIIIAALTFVGAALAAPASSISVNPLYDELGIERPYYAGDTVTMAVSASIVDWSVQLHCRQSGSTVFNSWRYPSGGVPTFTLAMNQFHDPDRSARCEARLWGAGSRIVASDSFVIEVAPAPVP